MKEDKKYRDRQRFPEKYLILQAQDASVVWVETATGESAHWSGYPLQVA